MSRRRQDSPLPTSKVMDPTDFKQLGGALALLDRWPEALEGQHEIRRWEYAMAHYAIYVWQCCRDLGHPVTGKDTQGDPLQILDLGGAGSHFWKTLLSLTSEDIVIVDPAMPAAMPEPGQRQLIAEPIELYASHAPHNRFDIITCISVIEHVPELRPFFRAAHMLLKPGGLLFLTTDFWDAEGPDTAHFHWMRRRIYNAGLMRKLLGSCRELGFRSLGPADWAYHGHQVYDYSVAAAALVKK